MTTDPDNMTFGSRKQAHDHAAASGDLDAQSKKLFWRTYWTVLALYLLTQFAGWYAVQHLPAGEAYILRSHSWGMLLEFLIANIALGALSLFYIMPSLFVRRSIGLTLRSLMFGLFVVSLAIFQSEKTIAVVQTPTSFIFIRPMPFDSREVPYNGLPKPRVKTTLFVTAMSLQGYPLVNPIYCKAVWHGDRQGQATLKELTAAIINARPTHTKMQRVLDALRSNTSPLNAPSDIDSDSSIQNLDEHQP